MSIYVISGDPGAGKSAYGVHLAEKHKRHDPRPIFSTYWIDVPGVEVVSWPEMCRLTGAVCIVDESADLFNARDYAKGDNKNQLALFREHRKDGLTLYLVSQGFDMLDTNIRSMCRYVWHIKRIFGPDFFENETKLEQCFGVYSRAKMYHAKTYTKETEGHKRRICLRTSYFRVDKLYHRFDTLAKSAGLRGDKNVVGAGLAAGSTLAGDRRQARRGRQPVPDWAYPWLGLSAPLPRVQMPFTKDEYFAWSQARPDDGVVRWQGPPVMGVYDNLPEELQVHPVRKTPITGGGF